MDFELLVRAIRNRLYYGQTRDEIHDGLIHLGASEDMFFLAWHAAAILDESE